MSGTGTEGEKIDWRKRSLRALFTICWAVGLAAIFGLFGDRQYLAFIACLVGIAAGLMQHTLDKTPNFPREGLIFAWAILAVLAATFAYQFLFPN
jgi:hypothetical protein